MSSRGAWSAFAIAVASRAFSIGSLLATAKAAGVTYDPLSYWDVGWYSAIARAGYHADLVAGNRHDFAFFPGWPVVIKIASLGFLPPAAVAVVLSNILFVAAAVLVWRLVVTRIDARAGLPAVALLSFAPPAYAYSMGYSESLTLFLAAAAFQTSTPWKRAAFAAGSAFTRLAGLAVAGAGVLAAVAGRRVPDRLTLLTLAAGVVGFGVWFAFIAWLTGNPLGLFTGAPSWIHGSVLHHQAVVIRAHLVPAIAWGAFVALLLVGTALTWRRDAELAAFAALVLLVAIASMRSVSVNSIARYAMPAFPAYAGLATRLGRRGIVAAIAISAAAEIAFMSWTFGAARVPP